MLISFLCYGVALMVGLLIIRKEMPLYIGPMLAMILSFWGHILGTYCYSLISSDSIDQFFPQATPYFNFSLARSTLAENLIWYIRYFFTGDSIIDTFYVFSSFAFTGGVLWYVLYLRCAKQLNMNATSLTWPAFILMCWPSFLFFTSGMGKDSLSFFFIPLAFLSYFNLAEKKKLLWNGLIFLLSIAILTAFRPYFLMILFITYFFYTSKGWRTITIKNSLSWMIIAVLTWLAVFLVLTSQGQLDTIDTLSISEKITVQQDYQAQGSHFEMPSDNPFFRILLLPYSFFMNLCFPLFYLAKNMLGYASSFENLLLVFLVWKTITMRKLVAYIFLQNRKIKLLFYFFIVGMLFMSAVNTNLGLAVRQKSMYLPAFLVIYCLVYAKTKLKARKLP